MSNIKLFESQKIRSHWDGEKEKKPASFDESKEVAKQGGTIADNTRKEIEAKTGKKIVSSQNEKALKAPRENKKLE